MQSHNSHYKGIFAKITEVLKDSDIPLSPKQILIRINMKQPLERVKYSTVRNYCRTLAKESIIENLYYGVYSVVKVRDGVTSGFGGVLVHNVVLTFVDVPVVRHDEVVESVGDVRVVVVFGVQNCKVTCSLAYDVGMDLFLFHKCMAAIKRIVWDKIGINIDGFEPTVCCEFNQDFQQFRMDGVKCVSVTDFVGQMERIYNKGNVLRREIKVQKTDLPTLLATLQGGASQSNLFQVQYKILQRLEELIELQKASNRLHVESLNAKNGVA